MRIDRLKNDCHPRQHTENGSLRQLTEPSQLHPLFDEHAEEIHSILNQPPYWPNHAAEEVDPILGTDAEPED